MGWNSENHYELADAFKIDKAKTEIKKLIDEGLNNKIITQEEHIAINPDEKRYCKVLLQF